MRETAAALLERVGLTRWANNKANRISGGQQQRVAIARALAMKPALVLADEPTGNLDAGNGEHVLGLMLELNRELSTSLVIVTHDHSIARRMDRVMILENGVLSAAPETF
jgi:lipoprotein-releasing system ATP-binding protein